VSIAGDAMLEIDIVVESEQWSAAPEAEPTLRRAIAAAAAALSTKHAELAIVLSDDSTIRVLNRDWRGVDAATNVLSFPISPSPGRGEGRGSRGRNPLTPTLSPLARGSPLRQGQAQSAPPLLGDIVLAYETIAREAKKQKKPFAHHLAHLGVHGFLHLLGYDHARDKDADAMERIERDILARLAIPDPYRHAAGGR
jgi:probable rRNA maturation factor